MGKTHQSRAHTKSFSYVVGGIARKSLQCETDGRRKRRRLSFFFSSNVYMGNNGVVQIFKVHLVSLARSHTWLTLHSSPTRYTLLTAGLSFITTSSSWDIFGCFTVELTFPVVVSCWYKVSHNQIFIRFIMRRRRVRRLRSHYKWYVDEAKCKHSHMSFRTWDCCCGRPCGLCWLLPRPLLMGEEGKTSEGRYEHFSLVSRM